MGTMSAPDAAPLPRLGEVFFDVRGNSRTMRLSWYADTGVAVLSIWQGGMCTGTFRLAMADLPRMVETLQRGPGQPRPSQDPAAPARAFAEGSTQVTGQTHERSPGDQAVHATEAIGYPAGPGGYRTMPAPSAAQPPAYPAEAAGAPGGFHPGEQPAYPGEPAGYHTGPAPVHAGPAEYAAERTEYTAAPTGYPAAPAAYQAAADFHAEAPAYPAGQASHPSHPARYPAGQASHPSHPARYPADPASHPSHPARYPAEPAAGRTPPAQYPGQPGDGSAERAQYPGQPGGDRVAPAHYPAEWHSAERPAYPAGPAGSQAEPAGYPGGPARSAGEPPGPRSDSGYLPQQPGYQPEPTRQWNPYQEEPDDYRTGPAGYREEPSANLSGPYGGSHPSHPLPVGRHGGGQAAAGLYSPATGQMDYVDEMPAGHYRGSATARRSEATDDNATHYAATVTDAMRDGDDDRDGADDPLPESLPYGSPAANRTAARRHGRPSQPFD
jgi:hypothetical protein